jgi:hypothetical protein
MLRQMLSKFFDGMHGEQVMGRTPAPQFAAVRPPLQTNDWDLAMTLPSKKLLIITTRLAPHQVRQRLEGAIAKPRGLNFLAPRPEPYKGRLKTDRFHIRRQGIAKHPYRPTIIGKFANDGRGTQVRLLMRPPLL